jgi:hypothetical protein
MGMTEDLEGSGVQSSESEVPDASLPGSIFVRCAELHLLLR